MGRRTAAGRIVAAATAGAAIVAASYGAAESALHAARASAATVATTACGHASGTTGSAIVLDDEEVLVAAHVVIAGTDLTVTHDGREYAAELRQLDPRTDLALLDVPGLYADSALGIGRPRAGSTVHIIGEGPSGSVDVEILRLVQIRIEEVRSTVRAQRFGFEIDHRVALGDSGAGVFDERGDLIGVVFGRSTIRDERSFVVHSEEIAQLLQGEESTYRCDPDSSRVVAQLSQ